MISLRSVCSLVKIEILPDYFTAEIKILIGTLVAYYVIFELAIGNDKICISLEQLIKMLVTILVIDGKCAVMIMVR